MKLKFIAGTLAAAAMLCGAAIAQSVGIGLHQDPPNIDPLYSQAFSDRSVTYQIFDRLVDIDETLNIVPLLATSWEVSDDGLVYTLQIREGVKFHDGTPVDAEAVRYTLNRNLTTPGSARADELSSISNLEVTGSHTIEITLDRPNAAFLAVLSGNGGAIVSPTAAEAAGDNFVAAPVGSGPYVYHDRERQNHLTLRANEDYWGGAPAIKELVFRPFPDGDVRTANLLSGAVDIIVPLEGKDVGAVEAASGYSAVLYDHLGWRALVPNVTRPPFDSEPIRRALAHALDREAIATVVYENTVMPLEGPFPPNTGGYNPELRAPAFDLEAARAALEEVDAVGTEFTLLILPHENLHGQFWQAVLTQAGFNVKLEQMEAGPYTEVVNNHNFDATLVGWSGRIDPDPQFYPFVHTDGNLNWGGYSDERLDELLDNARAEMDAEARERLYHEVANIVVDESLMIFIIQQQNLIGVSDELQEIPLIPDGTIRFHGVHLR